MQNVSRILSSEYLIQILKSNLIFLLLDPDVDPYHFHPLLRHHFLLWKWTPHNDWPPHWPNCMFLSIWVRIAQCLLPGTLPHRLGLQRRSLRFAELYAPGYGSVSVLFPIGKFIKFHDSNVHNKSSFEWGPFSISNLIIYTRGVFWIKV